MQHRCEGRVLLLGVFFICQLVVVALYIWSGRGAPNHFRPVPLRFQSIENTFYTADLNSITLPSKPVDQYFILINDTSCFRHGTDLRRSAHEGKCECLPGHHGNDCSLPEVIWRAFIALRRSAIITRRAGHERRIILVSEGDSLTHQATQLNELRSVVDLFVLSTIHNEKFLKGMQEKIIVGKSWRSAVTNLHTEDLVFHVPAHIVPLPAALLFFKLFDGFPKPIRFRLKWNVYGYFFQHPNRTRVFPDSEAQLTIGDLNHYGGWYCEMCADTINSSMQDAIGDGVYLDGKTPLIHAHSSQPYFAPEYLLNNSWQFDSLLTNFYKMDYN